MKLNPALALHETRKLLIDIKAVNNGSQDGPKSEINLLVRCQSQIFIAFGKNHYYEKQLEKYLQLSPWSVPGVLAERLEGFVEIILIPALVAAAEGDNTNYLKTIVYVLTLVLTSGVNIYLWDKDIYSAPILGFIELGIITIIAYIFYRTTSGQHILNLFTIVATIMGLIFGYLSVREYFEF